MKDQITPEDRDRGHRPRNVQPKEHDPYQRRKKSGAMVCDRCSVAYHAGRWYWGTPPTGDAAGGMCPACQRIEDRYPAGTIRLHAIPARDLREIIGMIRNLESREEQEHPLERLIALDNSGDELVVTTTGLHLARSIASALERRFHGGVSITYPAGESLVQVTWTGGEEP